MHNYKELKIWQRSKKLAVEIYKITKNFPEEEKFGLTIQLRRSAVSVPSNIAEGCGRNSDKQFVQFLSIAMGSLAELETQLIISYELKYMLEKDFDKSTVELNELQKMIKVLIRNKSKI